MCDSYDATRRAVTQGGNNCPTVLASVWQHYQGVIGMKLEIARGIFLVGALGITALATAAWQEPEPVVIGADGQQGPAYHPLPVAVHKQRQEQVQPDSDNLLLLVFGLSHAMKGAQ